VARGTRIQPGWNGSRTPLTGGPPTTRPLLLQSIHLLQAVKPSMVPSGAFLLQPVRKCSLPAQQEVYRPKCLEQTEIGA